MQNGLNLLELLSRHTLILGNCRINNFLYPSLIIDHNNPAMKFLTLLMTLVNYDRDNYIYKYVHLFDTISRRKPNTLAVQINLQIRAPLLLKRIKIIHEANRSLRCRFTIGFMNENNIKCTYIHEQYISKCTFFLPCALDQFSHWVKGTLLNKKKDKQIRI